MEDVKSFVLSKTIWGVVITALGSFLNTKGFDTGVLNGLDGEIVTVLGAVLAIYGRVKAVKKIGVK
jgi:hypothetical protein